MIDSSIKAIAVLCAISWLAAGALGAFRRPRGAVIINSALALLFLACAAPSILHWLHDPQAYVQRYGTAALTDLRLAGWTIALALAGLTAGGLTFWRYRWCVWLAWIANLPAVALFVYLAFWFRIF